MDGDLQLGLEQLPQDVLGRLMPLHLLLDAGGRVLSHGPTLRRCFPGGTLTGRPLGDLLALKGQTQGVDPAQLPDLAGRKLRLSPREGMVDLRLRGLLQPFPLTGGAAGWILNLSFGIDLARAVAQFQLTDADFAPTELAMELLYLTEANVAVTGELRGLAMRLENARLQARDEALTDTLTGLRNRRACDSILSRLCREGAAFGLMQMDLDFFKAVNDTLGHAAGDHVLLQVAAVLKSCSRTQDCIARVGGDEFVLILPGMAEAATLAQTAERVIAQLQQPIPFQDQLCRVSASFGYLVVPANDGGNSPADLLASTDLALYAAKKAGRGRAHEARDQDRSMDQDQTLAASGGP